jgi:hypothetical protein
MDDAVPAVEVAPHTLSRWTRPLSALPDAITACGCLVVWIAPQALGKDAVKTVLLMMLMEFILLHATGFFTTIAAPTDTPPTRRILKLLGLAAFYMLFVGVWAFVFNAWWPVTVFAWLVVGKIAWVFTSPRGRDAEMARQMKAWAFSMLAYVGAVFAGLMLPLPRLGLDSATVAAMRMTFSGAWIDRPHTAIASAVLYYSALALFKARDGNIPLPNLRRT